MPPIEMQLLKKITTVRKYNSILSICRYSWSPFSRHSVSSFSHFVASLPHRRNIPALRRIPRHFDAPYPHISSHRATWYNCKTGFSYETWFSCKTGYSLQNEGFSCESGFSCKAGENAKETRSRWAVEPRCWRPQLFAGLVRLLKY